MDEENAPPFIPDDELTDLDELKRRLKFFREMAMRLAAEAEPAEGEHRVFLSDEHCEMAQWLYDQRKLTHEQDSEEEYEVAFEEFVEGALEVFYDMARYEVTLKQGMPRRPPIA
jgi:hypothetical protein